MLNHEEVVLATIEGYKKSYGLSGTDRVNDALLKYFPEDIKRNERVRKAAGI